MLEQEKLLENYISLFLSDHAYAIYIYLLSLQLGYKIQIIQCTNITNNAVIYFKMGKKVLK